MENALSICLLDFQEEDVENIKSKGFNIYNGSAGLKVKIDHEETYDSGAYCILNYDYPTNLHEYDILAINMISDITIPYDSKEHNRHSISSDSEIKFRVSSPTNIFDPRPLSLNILNSKLEGFFNKNNIVIVFADREYLYNYQQVEFKNGYTNTKGDKEISNYSFWPDLPLSENKYGTKIKIISKNSALKKLLEEFSNIKYYLDSSNKCNG